MYRRRDWLNMCMCYVFCFFQLFYPKFNQQITLCKYVFSSSLFGENPNWIKLKVIRDDVWSEEQSNSLIAQFSITVQIDGMNYCFRRSSDMIFDYSVMPIKLSSTQTANCDMWSINQLNYYFISWLIRFLAWMVRYENHIKRTAHITNLNSGKLANCVVNSFNLINCQEILLEIDLKLRFRCVKTKNFMYFRVGLRYSFSFTDCFQFKYYKISSGSSFSKFIISFYRRLIVLSIDTLLSWNPFENRFVPFHLL